MMPLIVINRSTFINVSAIAFAELEKGFSGEAKLRVVFLSGTEQRFTGARAEALFGYLQASVAEPSADPGEELG